MAKNKIRIIWSAKAYLDFQTIHQNISEAFSIDRANKYVGHLLEKINNLKKSPKYYPPCRNKKLRSVGWRCIVHIKQYIVIYEIDGSDIILISIMPARQNPKTFEDLI